MTKPKTHSAATGLQFAGKNHAFCPGRAARVPCNALGALAESAAGDFQPVKKTPQRLVPVRGFWCLLAAALGIRQAFASAPHRLLPRRSRSPTGSTSRTGSAGRNARAFGLTSVLSCGAIGATDKLRANKMIVRCDHTRCDFVNAHSAPDEFANALLAAGGAHRGPEPATGLTGSADRGRRFG
jgi:hypothetical protein